MYCKNCGTPIEDGAKLCMSCGGESHQIKDESNNEVYVSDDDAGYNTMDTSDYIGNETGKPERKWLKRLIISVSCLVSVAALAVIGIFGYKIIMKNTSGALDYAEHPVIYLTDDEVHLKNLDAKEPYMLCDMEDIEDYMSEGGYYESYIRVSDDGNLVFFPVDIDSDDEWTYDLYYRKVKDKVHNGKKDEDLGNCIAKGISMYDITSDGKYAVYIKDYRLYYSDLSEQYSVSGNAEYFWIDNDSRTIVFKNSNSDYYFYTIGEEAKAELIDKDMILVSYSLTDDGKIYYTKNNTLYSKKKGEKSVKLATGIYNSWVNNNKIYYVREVINERGLPELFNDDCASSDAAMKEPEYDDFKKIVSGTYYTYTTTDYDAYRAAREKYYDKTERDSVREYYTKNPITYTTYTLYTINDGAEQMLDEGLESSYVGGNSYKLVYYNNSKINMSTVTDYSDALDKVSRMTENKEYTLKFIKSDGNVMEVSGVDADTLQNVQFVDDKYIYGIHSSVSGGQGTLYQYTVNDSGVASKEDIESGVSYFYVSDLADDLHMIEYSGSDNNVRLWSVENGELNKLSDDSSYYYHKTDDRTLYYFDDYDSDDYSGKLMKYVNGDSEIVDSDVYASGCSLRSNNCCYYIKDYNSNRNNGTLYYYDGDECTELDTDVSDIIY